MTETFDNLFVEKDELNETIVKNVLDGRVKLTSEGDVIFQKDFEAKQKILLYLISNKVFAIKKMKDNDMDGPSGICQKTGIPKGTVGRTLRELEHKGFVVSKDGKYHVPNHALRKVEALFTSEAKDQ